MQTKKVEEMTQKELIEMVKQLRKRKKYGLVWEEKTETVVEKCRKELPVLEEIKEKTIEKDSKGPVNILIEGDNYHSLSVLAYTHAARVDVIYIDPPYNTGNKDFKYNDEFVDFDDNFRHSKWLSFLEKRLTISKTLLKKSGFIAISIDDNEMASLKLLCDEIFGESNYLTTVVVKMSHLSGVKMSHLDKKLPKLKEYLLIYAKNKNDLQIQPIFEKVEWGKAFSRYNSFIFWDKENPQDITRWRVSPLKQAMIESKVDMFNEQSKYDFFIKNANRIFRTARNRSEQFIQLPNDEKFRKITTSTGLGKIAYKREEVIFASSKLKNVNNGEFAPVEPLGDLWTDIGINNLHNEGGVDFRNGKKPIKLIKRIIDLNPNKKALVVDFFAGSGTTGEAVLSLNHDNNGKRNFIICTNNENKISEEVCYKRIKNVIDGYNSSEGIPSNFHYFRTSFVPKSKVTDDTRRELIKRSTEMICIRENTFVKIADNKDFKIYEDGTHSTGILFNLDEIDIFKTKINSENKKANIYVFSLTNDTFDEDFEDLKVKHEICPIPESILEVYKKLFKN